MKFPLGILALGLLVLIVSCKDTGSDNPTPSNEGAGVITGCRVTNTRDSTGTFNTSYTYDSQHRLQQVNAKGVLTNYAFAGNTMYWGVGASIDTSQTANYITFEGSQMRSYKSRTNSTSGDTTFVTVTTGTVTYDAAGIPTQVDYVTTRTGSKGAPRTTTARTEYDVQNGLITHMRYFDNSVLLLKTDYTYGNTPTVKVNPAIVSGFAVVYPVNTGNKVPTTAVTTFKPNTSNAQQSTVNYSADVNSDGYVTRLHTTIPGLPGGNSTYYTYDCQ